MNTKIEISLKTIFLACAAVGGIWLLFQIKEILLLLFIAFLLMTALNPLVIALERTRLPRLLVILIIYAVIFGLFGFSVITSIPSLIIQTTRLTQTFPDIVAKVIPYLNVDLNTVGQQLAPIGENLVKVTVSIFSNIVTIVTILVFTFYFLLERRHAKELFAEMFGQTIAAKTIDILRAIEQRLGEWVRGELILMFIIGLFVYIGLVILQVEFALPLAIVAGLLEIVPTIGPIVSAIPAILIGLAVSPLLALSVAALYFIVQQVENNLVVPLVMRKSVGLSPIITILALMIGGKLAGIIGAILGVPVVLVIGVLINKLLLESGASKTTKN